MTKAIEGIRYTSQFVFSIFYRLMLFVVFVMMFKLNEIYTVFSHIAQTLF